MSPTVKVAENVGNNNKAKAIELASLLTTCLVSDALLYSLIYFENNLLWMSTVK